MSDDSVELLFVAAPHPSRLDPVQLFKQCEMKMMRRGGPGGQHRNKTSSGVLLTHVPTGFIAEASERRSQADNRRVALGRLRLLLAVGVRCAKEEEDETGNGSAAALRNRYRGRSIWVSESNVDRPALIALLLDELVAKEYDLASVAKEWRTSSSQIVRLLRSYPPALDLLNRLRRAHNPNARRLR
ncbi:MAG: peptide chain release factor-like protein [Pirellulaceae bacterium]